MALPPTLKPTLSAIPLSAGAVGPGAGARLPTTVLDARIARAPAAPALPSATTRTPAAVTSPGLATISEGQALEAELTQALALADLAWSTARAIADGLSQLQAPPAGAAPGPVPQPTATGAGAGAGAADAEAILEGARQVRDSATLHGFNLLDGSLAGAGVSVRTSLAGTVLVLGGHDLLTPLEALDPGHAEWPQRLGQARGAVEEAAVSLERQRERLTTALQFLRAVTSTQADLSSPAAEDPATIDLGREGARLQALQARQSLADQPLAIANQTPQALQVLFGRDS